MDLRNYQMCGDDDAVVEVFCTRCTRIIATTAHEDPDGFPAGMGGHGDPTLADVLTAATRHDTLHRTLPASGYVTPAAIEAAREQGRLIAGRLAPYVD